MGRKNRRRGSSTRKHKLPPEPPRAKQATIPFQSTNEAIPSVVINNPDKQRKHYNRIMTELRSGKDAKGRILTDEDITKKLNTLGSLELKLGIVHVE